MTELRDRVGLAAALETAGIPWRELSDTERLAYAVDDVAPSAICWPATYGEAARALAVADRLGIAVTPRGAGTKVGLGNPPRACDLVVSTERLNRVVEYAPANLTITVEAGLSLATLQETLATGGQFLPLDPPFADRATLGGILAANSSGPRRLGYGAARDLVIGTRVATTAGTVTRAGGRVVKNVAGYDLNKLYIGSLGTLAVLVEVGFKLAPRPAVSTTVIGRFRAVDQLGQAVRGLLRSPLSLVALDLLNGPAAAALGFADLPAPGSGYLLAALGTASGGGVVRQREDVARAFRAAGADEVVDLADERGDAFWTRVAAAPTEGGAKDGAVRVKIAVPPGRLVEAVKLVEQRVGSLGEPPGLSGRAGSGVLTVTGAVSPVARPASERPDAGLATLAQSIAELRASCRALGGSLVLEECPRALKQLVDVWGDVGSALPLMRRLKEALDPRGVLNPGRFVGGI